MKFNARLLFAVAMAHGALCASALEFKVEKNIPYYPEEVLVKEGPYARRRCLLDLKWPVGVSNFATVVNFHGGGIVAGGKSPPAWPVEALDRDPVAFVSGGYRLLTNATPAQAISDAAAAVAWTLKNISKYGGDPKKVFVTGISAGGYLTAMVGMDYRWLAPHGFKPTDLAGIIPLTGQMTKHFNVRRVGFKDTDPQFMPKIDEWAPLHYASTNPLPPSCFLTGGRDIEWKARVEENALLEASLRACGHRNCEFHETEGNHGGGVYPSRYFLRDFVMKTCDAGGVARFADGERVAFFGDSITHSGYWHVYLQLFWSTRHPGSNVRVLNCGISGDTASGSRVRMRSDLLAMKPDRVFVMFGMNDVGLQYYADENPSEKTLKIRADRKARYVAAQREIADTLAKKGIKTVFVTPSPYDQYSPVGKKSFGNEQGLACFAEEVRKLAAERSLAVVDLHRPLTEMFKARRDDPFCADRVHPNKAGHMVMAALVLDAMRVKPLVARVALNAKNGQVYRAVNGKHRDSSGRKLPDDFNASVTRVSVREDGVAFTYAPGSLPFPGTAEYSDAEKSYPLTERLNQEIFAIENLPSGTYELSFDGNVVGAFAAEEFARGVNVALLDTPNQRRAKEAMRLAEELRAQCVAWRGVVNIEKRHLVNNRVDPSDRAAVDAFLAKRSADMEKSRNPSLGYWKGCVRNYNAQRDRKKALLAGIEDAYERLNAVRPAVSRVVLKLKK